MPQDSQGAELEVGSVVQMQFKVIDVSIVGEVPHIRIRGIDPKTGFDTYDELVTAPSNVTKVPCE